MDNSDFCDFVKVCWSSMIVDLSVNDMSCLAHKLRILKKKVKVWICERTLQLKLDYMNVVEEISGLLSSHPSGILSSEDTTSL